MKASSPVVTMPGRGQWQQNARETPGRGCPVDQGRFFQFAGHRLEEVGQHPDGEGEGEREVGNDERWKAVEEAGRANHLEERAQNGDLREHRH